MATGTSTLFRTASQDGERVHDPQAPSPERRFADERGVQTTVGWSRRRHDLSDA